MYIYICKTKTKTKYYNSKSCLIIKSKQTVR